MDVDSSPQLPQVRQSSPPSRLTWRPLIRPPRHKHSQTYAGISSVLDDGKDAALQDTDFSVPLVPVSYFTDYLLPRGFLDNFDVDAVVEDLRKKKYIDSDGRWIMFPEDPHLCDGQKEDLVFKPLATLVQCMGTGARRVFKAAHGRNAKVPQQTVEWRCNPTITPLSTNRHSSSKPDSFGVLKKPTAVADQKSGKKGAPHWDDIVVPGEHKKNRTNADFNDNNAKIIWSLHHGMRETVQRRFMFGYTIEDTDMRLWFCNRSSIIVSETFNFVTDHRTLVHFFLSIMFSPPSQLGYDPTISVKFQTGDQKTNIYHIGVQWKDPKDAEKVNTTIYQTSEVIANIGAEALRGRGTRVWRGKKIEGEGRNCKVVVKDCWIDSDRIREGDILAEILKAASDSPDPTDLSTIKEHFFSVVHHGDVLVDKMPDHTFSLHRHGKELPTTDKLDLKRVDPKREVVINPPRGTITMDDDVTQWMKTFVYHDKIHYRIVYESEEEFVPIDAVQQAFLVWTGLYDALTALKVLHKLGYVHRDISAGNVLVSKGIKNAGGVGKIIDLEFCKRINDRRLGRGHQGRTGTRYFIPVEVNRQRYEFVPKQPKIGAHPSTESQPVLDSSNSNWRNIGTRRRAPPRGALSSMSSKAKSASQLPAGPRQPAFFSNPIHDLESLWWLAVYLVLTRAVKDEPAEQPGSVEGTDSSEDTIEDQGADKEQPSDREEVDDGEPVSAPHARVRHWAIRLLVDNTERLDTLKDNYIFSTETEHAHEYVIPMTQNLDKARQSLVEAYTRAEANLYTTGVDLGSAVNDVHSEFEGFFTAILLDLLNAGDFDFYPMPTKFVLPSFAAHPIAAHSLDPALMIAGPKKRLHDEALDDEGSDDGNSDDEHTSVTGITYRMAALKSPTRANKAKRARLDGMVTM